jgi:hypothetical protein
LIPFSSFVCFVFEPAGFATAAVHDAIQRLASEIKTIIKGRTFSVWSLLVVEIIVADD